MKLSYVLGLAVVCATSVSAQEHLAAPRCIPFTQVSGKMTPVDLYPMAGQCIQDSDYADALAIFSLAGADIRYDRSRIRDKTANDVGSALLMRMFQPVSVSARKRFGDVIDAVLADRTAAEYLCRSVREAGPPAYYPEYMIMHGMDAVVAGLNRTPLPQEDLPVSDPAGRWKTIITGYLHCSLTEVSGSRQDAQAADRYRQTVADAIARSNAEPAGAAQGSHPVASPASAKLDQSPAYGPLTFNREGADFYFAQDGKFAPASIAGDVIEIHLHPRSFQIGYNGEQMNLCLALVPFAEVRTDPTGYKVSCLAGAMSGARAPNSDALLVYSGKKWSDGNSALTDAASLKAAPMKGFRFAYQVNQLQFVTDPAMSLSRYKGTLYGYITVYLQPERSQARIMPIRLVFE